MKTITTACALALGLAGAAQAAVDPAELKVGGQVKTPACVVTLSGDGVFKYGLMSSSLLPVTGHVALDKKTQKLTVDCGTGSTYLSYWPTDNRDGTASSRDADNEEDGAFGLGRIDARPDSKIGYYTVALMAAKVDGRDVLSASYSLSRQQIHGLPTHKLRHKASTKDEIAMTWGTTPGWGNLGTMVSGSRFEVDVEVSPYLASRSVVGGGEPITDTVNIDGSATLTFKFGL